MTKLEFHQNMLKIFNNRYYSKIYNVIGTWKIFNKKLRKLYINKDINYTFKKEEIKVIRLCHKRLPNITYKSSCNMYDFLKTTGLEYDFDDKNIIIHYPLLYIESSDYYIKDLYFKFNPIFCYDNYKGCFNLNMAALRTTYTVEELLIILLHPHIQFNLNFEFSYNICTGSTIFEITKDTSYEVNFYRFILYLENFLTHEHTNPYQATANTENLNYEYEYKYLTGNVYDLPWNEVEFEYKNIDDKQYVVPKVNHSEIEFYKKHFENSITYKIGNILLNDTTLNSLREKVEKLENLDFYFKGVKVKPIIEGDFNLKNSNKVVEVINESFKNTLQNATKQFFTEKFIESYFSGSLETESIANKISNEAEPILM